MNTVKILVVDDEPKIRRIVSSYLVEEGSMSPMRPTEKRPSGWRQRSPTL